MRDYASQREEEIIILKYKQKQKCYHKNFSCLAFKNNVKCYSLFDEKLKVKNYIED